MVTKARTAPAARTPLELKAEAVKRVQARLRAAKYTEVPDGRGSVIRWQTGDAGIAEPETASEWLDDRAARTPCGAGECDLLQEMWERVRTGGVAEAVGLAADRLRGDKFAQFTLFTVIAQAPAGPGDVAKALRRAWDKARLATAPVPVLPFEPMDLDAPSEAAKRVVYREPLGNPAGMTI